MSRKHYTTEIFETMKWNKVRAISSLFKKINMSTLMGQPARELEFLSKFYSGKLHVHKVADDTIYITSTDLNDDFYKLVYDGSTNMCTVAHASPDSVQVAYHGVTVEHYYGLISIVQNGEAIAVWPKKMEQTAE